jgi:hypothetical protein
MNLFRWDRPSPIPSAIIGAVFLALAIIGIVARERETGEMIGGCIAAAAVFLGSATWDGLSYLFRRRRPPKN